MLKKKVRGLICSVVATLFLIPSISVFAAETDVIKGNYDIVVEGFDWGPGVTKAIVTLNEEVTNVTKDTFKVEEVKNWYTGIANFERKILNAYTSDEAGNIIDSPSKYVVIEMDVNPMEGSPFLYNFQVGYNTWTDPYSLNIRLSEDSELKSGDSIIDTIEIESQYINRQIPSIDGFKEASYTSKENISMKYAYYEPENNDDKKPLIVWLHGAGEGGSDTTINTLGNKVTALIEDNIQNQFDGAYVLAPQTPTMWMDMGGVQYTDNGDSIYLNSLMDLIKNYVDTNKNIDTDRIYIGGCSNGGFMTMALVLENPEYFAAAYPICEAYSDSWISDDKLEGIKDLPIWFTYANNDKTVDPLKTSVATANRLKNIKAKDVRISEFDKVVDTSGLYKDENGNPYEYDGHWSWVYAFNDECKDNGESLWSWLAKQKKEVKVDDSIDKPEENKPNDDNLNTPDNNENNDNVDKPNNDIDTPNNNENTPNDDVIITPDDNNNNTDKPNNNTSKPNNNTGNNESQLTNEPNKLPETGDVISSTSLALIGILSILGGIKIRFGK